MSGILGLFVDRGLQGLLFGGQGALDFEGAGVGCGPCQCGICYRLRMLLAHLRQLGLCIADAGLLHAAGQQRTGHGAGCGECPPGQQIEGHGRASNAPTSQCNQMLMAQSIHSPMSIIPALRPNRRALARWLP
ncbi:MAG TPA: hypothetical protein PKK15_19875 [Kouleothrix sp.]|nr:hypothetical protein [Kouleothrix sp.]